MTRFWELDFLRGVAVVGMIVFHAAFDVEFLGIAAIGVNSGFWWLLARAVAVAFVFIAGACMLISWERTPPERRVRKFVSRGLLLLGLGVLITIATYAFFAGRFVDWLGVLHFLGLASILAIPVLSLTDDGALWRGAVASIALGVLFDRMVVESPWLFWLGLRSAGFASLDYFPVFPWLGVLLLGAFAGRVFYGGGVRRFKIGVASNALVDGVGWLGKNSLWIYFLHQPLLYGALSLIR